MNRRGKSLVDTRDGILLANKRLRGDTTRQSREIDEVLDRAKARQRRPGRQRFFVARSLARMSDGRPLQLVATALHDGDPAGHAEHRSTILFLGDYAAHRLGHPELLGVLFDLSPTEARVAAAIANGQSLYEVAGKLGLGIGTVRWHVKRIMSRTDTRRQAELVRMILLSPVGILAA